MKKFTLALSIGLMLMLSACGGDPEPDSVPATTPPPTDDVSVVVDTPVPTEVAETEAVEATEEIYDPLVEESDLRDETALTDEQVGLILDGIVSGELPAGNVITDIELNFNEGDNQPDDPDSIPAHYLLRIQTGQVVDPVRTILVLFRADLEPGTYPITNSVIGGFRPDHRALGSIIGAGANAFDRNTQGLLRFTRDGDTFSGSFAYSGGNLAGEFVTINVIFGPVTVSEAEDDS
jgi:hypothetical protein